MDYTDYTDATLPTTQSDTTTPVGFVIH